jgi:O-antigen ligase
LLLPIIISDKAMAPTGPCRFIALAVFLFGSVTVLVLRQKVLTLRFSPLNRLLLALAFAFLGVLVVTSCTAVNKQEGLYCTIRFALFLATAILFTRTMTLEEEGLLRLCQCLSIVLVLQSLVGILQYYDLAFSDLPPKSGAPYGLMANRNLLASGVALFFPFAAYVGCEGTVRWKAVSGLSLWLGVYTLILTQTRGAWVALFAGLVVSNGLVVFMRKRLGLPFVKGWGKAMALFLIGTLVALGLSTALDTHRELRSSLTERGLSLAQPRQGIATDTSIQARLHFWRECLELMRDHPLLGVGPGNWRVAAAQYTREGSANVDGIRTRDRAHNVYLQTGAETGIPGVLIYLALLATAAFTAWRVLARAEENRRRLLSILMLGGLAIFVTDAVFSFPDEFAEHLLLLALIVGVPLGLYERRWRQELNPSNVVKVRTIYLAAPALALFAFAAYLNHLHGNFQYHLRLAGAYKKLNDYQEILAEVEAGRSRWVTISPLCDPLEFWSSYGYAGLGDLPRALEQIQRARQWSPWNPRVWNEMGTVYGKMRRLDDAIRCYEEALRLAPQLDIALKNAGNAYYEKGMFRAACLRLDKCKLDDPYLIKISALAHQSLGEFEKAADVLRAGLAQFPDQIDLLELLAYLEYSELKRMPDAYNHFSRLLQLKPDHPKRDEYSKVLDYLRQALSQPAGQQP